MILKIINISNGIFALITGLVMYLIFNSTVVGDRYKKMKLFFVILSIVVFFSGIAGIIINTF